MKKDSKISVKLVFFRTLFSQSAASITMSSIASYLRSNRFEIDLCLLKKDDLHNTKKILSGSNDKMIIIAKPNFKDFKEMFFLLSRIKKIKDIKIFLCGPFAALNSKGIMKSERWVDGIIMDEEEKISLSLAEIFSKQSFSGYSSLEGGVWRDNLSGKIYDCSFVCEGIPLEKLPFPARDIEMQEVTKHVNIEASRGCLFNCSFCHIPIGNNKNKCNGIISYRKPKSVIDEYEGMDEVSICPGGTQVAELDHGKIREYVLHASDFGISDVAVEEITPKGNKGKFSLSILKGEISGPPFQMIIANAAMLFYLSGKSFDFKECYEMAMSTHKSGLPYETMLAVKEMLPSQ